MVSNLLMVARGLIAALLFCSCAAFGQLSGRLFLDKEIYAPGEPVFLYFEVKNAGSTTQKIMQADPYSFCSGYKIKFSTDPGEKPSCAGYGFAGSCLSSDRLLAPGAKYSERVLLNYDHELTSPGEYEVEASRSLWDGGSFASPILELNVQLHFRIEASGGPASAELKAWRDQLRSKDPLQRREAARVIASLAPPSMEEVLLGFADDPELRSWAPLGLSRLNTARSIEALAELVRNAAPGTAEHMQSAEFLARTGDSKWFPLLAEVARKKAQISSYVAYAAQAGGEKALPLLLELLQSPDKDFTQLNATMALGDTGSRDAIPILLNLLKNPNLDVSSRAVYGLRQLTHRTFGNETGDASPQDQFLAWLQWWTREGSNAHIYKPGECSDFVPLN